MPQVIQQIMTAALIVVSLLLVSGITYVYTNRNKRATVLFTVSAIFLISLLKLIGYIHIQLHQTFLEKQGEFDSTYIEAQPGWGLLIHAWHIWILPVIFVFLLALFISYAITHHKNSNPSKLEVHPPLAPALHNATHAERLSTFMTLDAAKKESRTLHQKLTAALLNNTNYEIEINDLNSRISDLELELKDRQKNFYEQTRALETELNAKNKETEYLIVQLEFRSKELSETQTILNKLTAINQKITPPD